MSTANKDKLPSCVICGTTAMITFHHLIPKTCHSNKWFKKNFTREQMLHNGIDICRDCHSFLHSKFSEKHLGRELNTLEKLLNHEEIMKYAVWARKQARLN